MYYGLILASDQLELMKIEFFLFNFIISSPLKADGMLKKCISSPQFNNLPKHDIQVESMLQFNKQLNAFSILFTKLCLIVNNNL